MVVEINVSIDGIDISHALIEYQEVLGDLTFYAPFADMVETKELFELEENELLTHLIDFIDLSNKNSNN